ncbi:hypothetical protein BST61_g5729 [Cercospora zeina]
MKPESPSGDVDAGASGDGRDAGRTTLTTVSRRVWDVTAAQGTDGDEARRLHAAALPSRLVSDTADEGGRMARGAVTPAISQCGGARMLDAAPSL